MHGSGDPVGSVQQPQNSRTPKRDHQYC